MQSYRHALVPGETDHELVWLVVSLGAFLGLAVWLGARWPTPQCAFHSLTGLPCLTCGATRAAFQFLHGHFATSFLFNPLAFLTYCTVVAFDLYALAVVATGAPRLRFKNISRWEKLVARWGVVLLVAANWAYLLTARPV
jgi:uncharacterized protein DUF2752